MASDEAVVARICAHMNRDHSDNVQDYAAFYARLPAPLARTATLTGITLDHLELTVTASKGGAQSTVNIPLSPPMGTLGDARVRLIAMAMEAMEGLGRSRFKVTRWRAPSVVDALIGLAVCFSYWAFYNGAREFAPGGFIKEYAPPTLARFTPALCAC